MDFPNDEPVPQPGNHLTDMETCWTTVRNAHTPGPVGELAMRELIGRYHDAVERYLRLKLRDQNPPGRPPRSLPA